MRRPSIGSVLLVVALLAAVAVYVVPRGIEARALLAIADDPVRIADRALDETFNAALATREIEQALADKDADLAHSFVELAAARHVALDPALTEKVNVAVAEAATARQTAESFARGLITGEPKDMAGLAGTTLGDLFVFGDLRDAAREGGRLAMGEPADELILGLAGVGLAITAGTYATLGASMPARVGLSVAKAARKSGRLGADLAATIGRMLRGVVDWGRLKQAIAGASISAPALAIHGAREAVKIERAGGLIHLARDVGRVAGQGRHASRARRLAARRKPARNGTRCQTRRKGRQPHPRHSQDGRPRRHRAHGRHLRPRAVDARRAVHRLRPGGFAQEHDRAHHFARAAQAQGAPPATPCGAWHARMALPRSGGAGFGHVKNLGNDRRRLAHGGGDLDVFSFPIALGWVSR